MEEATDIKNGKNSSSPNRTPGAASIDKEAFRAACEKAASRSRTGDSIGTLGEKSLHAVLKWYYEPDGSRHEIPVGSYVADIVGEHGVIEIQTRGVAHLRPKLTELLEAVPVTVVHPVILRKRIVSLDGDTGEVASVRFSPKHGSLYTAMRELYALKPLLPQQRLTVRLPLLEADEIRSFGVHTRRRKKQRARQGEYVSDILPTDIVDEIILAQPSDYDIFLPAHLSGPFGAAELAQAAVTDLPTARRVLNLLTFLGLTEAVGKDGRRILYRRAEEDPVGVKKNLPNKNRFSTQIL